MNMFSPPSDALTQDPTLGVVNVMGSTRANQSPDTMTSQAELLLMITESGPAGKQTSDDQPPGSGANGVSTTEPLPSTARQATAVLPLKSDSNVKLVETRQQVWNRAKSQAGCPSQLWATSTSKACPLCISPILLPDLCR